MLERLAKKVNEREYQLFLNDKPLNITSRRLKGLKQQFKQLSLSNELDREHSFFIYKEKNFASFGLSEEVDLAWVDFDNKVIHIEESYITNKISKEIPNTKYIYILQKGNIKRNKIILNSLLTHSYSRTKAIDVNAINIIEEII